MVVVASLVKEESHHHGGPILTVQDQATIPENGVETANVCVMRPTEDSGPGERTPINIEQEKSPSMVYGQVERFGDVRGMVGLWEALERDEEEWLSKEGRRRGGRKLSRRISELLQNFEGGDKQMDRQPGPENSNIVGKVNFSSLSLTSSNTHHHSKISNTQSNRKLLKVVRCTDGLCASVRQACDWPNSKILLTNRKRAKRKGEDMEIDNWGDTKRRRPGVNR